MNRVHTHPPIRLFSSTLLPTSCYSSGYLGEESPGNVLTQFLESGLPLLLWLFRFSTMCVRESGGASLSPASPAAPAVHTHTSHPVSGPHCTIACNGQAWLKSCPEPHVSTPSLSPLRAPVALGYGLFNGATPVWEQSRAQDTGRHLSKLAIFSPKEPNHTDGRSGLAGRLPHPSHH